ncbi:hypothetical protein OC835_001236 [Tilletia horrida]|nr:hypothetical protein OC835_001236 [Tilletia horrida]
MDASSSSSGAGAGASSASAHDARPNSDHTSPLLSFPTISATAFLLGATTACLVSLRRGRTAAAREKLERFATRHGSASREQGGGVTVDAAQRGSALALFSELNAAAFRRGSTSGSFSSSSSSSSSSSRTGAGGSSSMAAGVGGVPGVLSAKARGKQPANTPAPAPARAPAPAQPAVLKRRRTQAEGSNSGSGPSRDMWSGFDPPTGAPPPAVLMRRAGGAGAGAGAGTAIAAATATATATSSQHSSPPASLSLRSRAAPNPPAAGGDVSPPPLTAQDWDSGTTSAVWDSEGINDPSGEEHESDPNETIWTSPVGLAVGAFTIATALVGCTAFVALQVAKAAIGFRTTDEFVQRMADLVPSRSSTSAALGLPPASSSDDDSEADAELYRAWEEDADADAHAASTHADPASPPDAKSTLRDALARLEQARSPAEWWDMFRQQLDAERDEDVRARAERVAAAAAAAGQGVRTE